MYAVKGVETIIHACSGITLPAGESFGIEMGLIEQQLDGVLWSNRRETGKKKGGKQILRGWLGKSNGEREDGERDRKEDHYCKLLFTQFFSA